MNAQVVRYTLVTKGDLLAKLFSLTRWGGALKDWGGPHLGERPTVFIALLMPKKTTELMHFDIGIAAQTIQLAATSRGWGCCIIKSFDQAASAELLKIPTEMQIALLLGLGVAKEKRVIAPMPADGSFKYWRDPHGVHYVPKRSLEELIVARYCHRIRASLSLATGKPVTHVHTL